MQISITKNANALAVGETYYVKIGSGTYPFTTTNAASNTDDIGQGLADEINDNAPGVSSSYDADVNIISIIPLQNEISISTSVSTASHDLKVLSSVTGDGCKAITEAIVIEVDKKGAKTSPDARGISVDLTDFFQGKHSDIETPAKEEQKSNNRKLEIGMTEN